jgi:predicted nucleic acid-binding protein
VIVVDTSILIDHLRGDPRARALLRDAFQQGRRLAASVLTKVEVLAGVRPAEEAETARLLALFDWIPVDESLADRAGELARQYLPSYPGIDPVDVIIAATVEHRGADLWTRNRKHFPMFPVLSDPYTS